MKFIHSADWQIGARFRQFGAKADQLRAARIRTLQRALSHARSVQADAFLIAGDLFEDNEVDRAVAHQVFDVFATFAEIPIFIAPGNHDPFTGPGCIWARPPFSQPPAHVTIFREPSAVEITGGWLLANPLLQKRSVVDPSLRLVELAQRVPAGAVKIGLTHGSLAIESVSAADDFPIDLNAASRAGLDYLAIGHWHSAQSYDGGRLVMAGTPEQTDFAEHGAGNIHEVTVSASGAAPIVKPVKVGELTWRAIELDAGDSAAAPRQLARELAELGPIGSAVVRLVLRGEAAPEALAGLKRELEEQLAGCLVAQIQDATKVAFRAEDLEEIRRDHPLLAEVLAQLRRLEQNEPLSEDLRRLAEHANLPAEAFQSAIASMAERVLLREWREVCERC